MPNKFYQHMENKLNSTYGLELYKDIFLEQKEVIIALLDVSDINQLQLELICGNLERIGFDDQPSIGLTTILNTFDYNNKYGEIAGKEDYYRHVCKLIYDFSTPQDVSFPILHRGMRKWLRFNIFSSSKREHLKIVYITDVTKLHTQEEETFGKSHVDSLTQLFNKYTFDYHYAFMYLIPGFHVLFMDIDNFKSLNDLYGHAIGNKVLQEYAKKLNALSNRDTRFYRLGGDEFVGLVIGSTEEVIALAGKLIEHAHTIQIEGVKEKITVSIGAMKATKSEDLARKADQLMYQAKSLGKDRYIYGIEADE